MQSRQVRGADVVAMTLAKLGVNKVFSVSGNHIMSIYDALNDHPIDIIHARHEAACVHMADAYARTTGNIGVAMVTAGQGHTNASAALFTARASNAPVLLLSGHAPLKELGHGAFQELRQADSAAPLTKASWTAQRTEDLGRDIARAARIASGGRPGPVHLSLPTDVLEQTISSSDAPIPDALAACAAPMPLSEAATRQTVTAIAAAQRPLILCGPTLCRAGGQALMDQMRRALRAPAVGMESPRGINDPSLGTFAGILARADLLVLIGKPVDFTLHFARAPFVSPDCRFIALEADEESLAATRKQLNDRLILSASADAVSAARALGGATPDAGNERNDAWLNEAVAAFAYRPPSWRT
ncbi:MAG: thiamine pyrophosphate-binding protein, partial [Candidimonas sp.]